MPNQDPSRGNIHLERGDPDTGGADAPSESAGYTLSHFPHESPKARRS